MKVNLLAVLAFISCSTVFGASIDFEIWDIGNGSSREVIQTVKALTKEFVESGDVKQVHEYKLNHVACCGAYKACYDIDESSDFDSVLKAYQDTAEGHINYVNSCEKTIGAWTLK